jgi:hypothetical protein
LQYENNRPTAVTAASLQAHSRVNVSHLIFSISHAAGPRDQPLEPALRMYRRFKSSAIVSIGRPRQRIGTHNEVPRFLNEVHRVLVPGGILRVVVPDLLTRVQCYVQRSRDSNQFLWSLNLESDYQRELSHIGT